MRQIRTQRERPQRRHRRYYAMAVELLEPRCLLSLTHLYTFNDGTANDTIGGFNGTLVHGATVVEGWLTLQNTNGTSSNTLATTVASNSTAAQYVQLPAGTLPATGSATLEVWYTTSSAMANWERIFDFGNQIGGAGSSYLYFTPRSSSNDSRAVLHPAGGSDRLVNYTTNAYDGFPHMAAVVVDAGTSQLRLYIDGNLTSTVALSGAGLSNISPLLGYLGRSLFDVDPAFNGSIDELRIYNDAESATNIAAHAAQGAARPTPTLPARQIENLDRGVVAFNRASSQVYLSWRLLAADPGGVAFNVYRSTNGGAAVKRNATPITKTTDYTDTGVTQTSANTYFVRAVINGVEQADSRHFTIAANTAVNQYLNIPLHVPAGGTVPDVSTNGGFINYTYLANDASVGDLDGDGQYEVIVKWDTSLAHDSSQDGYTGPTLFDAYTLGGTFLWRINLGQNIRAGAHYTQFMVYDLDGDGKAEIVMKTAPGTIDGLGNPVLMGTDHVTDDYRNTSTGRINTGPEYLTVFSGATGAQLTTVAFKPDRINTSSWGDDYGNRQDRILMSIAYLDGQRPSVVIGRGLFPGQSSGHAVRNELTAWNFRGGSLTMLWWFRADKNTSAYGLPNVNTAYIGQGNYEMQPADVDGDGKDEIIYGSMTINSNGTPRYSTGLGHGDALGVSDFDPTHPGLEVYMPMESPGSNGHITANLHDASTGAILFATFTRAGDADPDVGRGNMFDIDPRYTGAETWDSYNTDIYNVDGSIIQAKPSNMPVNFAVQWDADPVYETLDGTTIGNWTINASGVGGRSNFSLNPPVPISSNNSTKSTPNLQADIFGDYREEVIWRTSDNTALQIWSTVIPANYRMDTLMDDVQYREAIAWQNVGYNQPPHTSFFFGDGMHTAPAPNVYFAGGPSNILTSPGTIAENQSTGTLIGGLSSTPSGSASTYTYSFVTGPGSIDNASFSIVGGQLFTAASFDFEAKSTYTIRVRTTDANGLFYDRQLTITVTNVNEAPTIALAAGGTPNPVTGATTILSALGADDAGEANLSYNWTLTGTPPAAVTYSSNNNHGASTTTATFTRAGTYNFQVTITDAGSLTVLSTTSVTVYSSVAGRQLFYANSFFDSANHNTAIATDKTALLPGQAATFANYTSFSRGINGVMIDLARPGANLTAADFTFRVGNDNNTASWVTAPTPIAVNNRPGAGAGGSTRIEILWASNTIVNLWLQVTLNNSTSSGLQSSDVFYFGNAIGESGTNPTSARVDAVDVLSARAAATASAFITNPNDFNRDGHVDALDQTVARTNGSSFLSELHLIAPAGSPSAPALALPGSAPAPAAPPGDAGLFAADGVSSEGALQPESTPAATPPASDPLPAPGFATDPSSGATADPIDPVTPQAKAAASSDLPATIAPAYPVLTRHAAAILDFITAAPHAAPQPRPQWARRQVSRNLPQHPWAGDRAELRAGDFLPSFANSPLHRLED